MEKYSEKFTVTDPPPAKQPNTHYMNQIMFTNFSMYIKYITYVRCNYRIITSCNNPVSVYCGGATKKGGQAGNAITVK